MLDEKYQLLSHNKLDSYGTYSFRVRYIPSFFGLFTGKSETELRVQGNGTQWRYVPSNAPCEARLEEKMHELWKQVTLGKVKI